MITVALMTCDVTGPPGRTPRPEPVQKSFKLVRIDQDNLAFHWSTQNEQPIEGTLGIVDWEEFLGQVRELEPHRWTTDQQLPGPMGEGGLPNIMRQGVGSDRSRSATGLAHAFFLPITGIWTAQLVDNRPHVWIEGEANWGAN